MTKIAIRLWKRHWLLIVTVVLVFLYLETAPVLAAGIGLLGTGLWLGVMVPTNCGARGTYTMNCDLPARGVLRGCRHYPEHGRAKRRAVWATFRFRYPTDAARKPIGSAFHSVAGNATPGPTASYVPTLREIICVASIALGFAVLALYPIAAAVW